MADNAAKKTKQVEPKLLSGGNPQIPKGDGDAPVQAYIAALPGWKHEVGQHLDALIVAAVPDVQRAVKWNSAFYGSESQEGWFVSLHSLTKYLKVAFFNGASLDPLPPIDAKDPGTRYFHIYEDDVIDAAQLTSWFEQASHLPGWGKR